MIDHCRASWDDSTKSMQPETASWGRRRSMSVFRVLKLESAAEWRVTFALLITAVVDRRELRNFDGGTVKKLGSAAASIVDPKRKTS